MGTVLVGLADDVVAALPPADRSIDARIAEFVVTELYRRGDPSRGKVAQLLGVSLDDRPPHSAADRGIPCVDDSEAE